MTLHPIDVAIILLYLIGIVISGFIFARRASQGIESYFLGGRNIPWYVLGVSNASGQFDITGTMWMVMLLFVYGLKSLWIPWLWPTFNQVFLMIFLAAWLRRSGALTGAEWLRTRFGRGASLELAHISVVVFSLVTVVAFIAYAFIGVGKFAEQVLPWELSANTYALIILCATAAYVVLGGMYSVVLTDVIQFVLLTAASIIVAAIAISHTTGEQIAAATPDGWNSLWFGWRLDLDWTDRVPAAADVIKTGGYELFAPFLAMAFCKGVLASIAGPTPGYDLQRVLAARSDREASLMSGIVSPVLYVPRYLLIAGITALALVYYSETLAQQTEPDFESILPYVLQNLLPVGLIGVIMAGLFAAFMSTFDSTVNAGAAYLVNDIYKRYLNPDASPRRLVQASYIASIMVVAAGLVFGLQAGDINENLQWIAGGLYGGYVAPNILKWIWWRLNGTGYFYGMIAGIVLALGVSQAEPMLDWAIKSWPQFAAQGEGIRPYMNVLYLFPVLLLGSGAASVIASLATPVGDFELLKRFYRHVRPWGFWGPVREAVIADGDSLEDRSSFASDMLNCAVGIAWQISLCGLPVYLVLRDGRAAIVCAAVAIAATLFLKFRWYDQLETSTAESAEV